MSEIDCHESRPWFDADDDGRVTRLAAAARHLGIATGMTAPLASQLLGQAAGGVDWSRLATGGWRCQPAQPDDLDTGTGAERQRLASLRCRLQDEVRRRKTLERQLISATETERRRISLELHDGLGQHLSGLAYTARSLATRLSNERHGLAAEADWLARLLRDAVGRVRAMSRGLWPVSLERKSLPQSLAWLARDVEQLYGVTVQVRVDGFVAESSHAAHHLFRIAQEAVHNAIKHGQARSIEVHLERIAHQAMLSIVSDGKPMDAQAAQASEGLGLIGMRLRADALGGSLSIEALPAGGVEVNLIWTPQVAEVHAVGQGN